MEVLISDAKGAEGWLQKLFETGRKHEAGHQLLLEG